MQNIKDLSIKAQDLFLQRKYKEALSIYYDILSVELDDSMCYYNIAMTYSFHLPVHRGLSPYNLIKL